MRERVQDILPLTEFFVAKFAARLNKPIDLIPDEVVAALQAHDWPGNIRELQNVIERSVIVSETETFSVDESWFSRQPPPTDLEIRPGLFSRLPAEEKAIIEAALRECGGRVYGPSGAATKLGMPRSTLESKIRSLKINKNRFKGTDPLKDS